MPKITNLLFAVLRQVVEVGNVLLFNEMPDVFGLEDVEVFRGVVLHEEIVEKFLAYLRSRQHLQLLLPALWGAPVLNTQLSMLSAVGHALPMQRPHRLHSGSLNVGFSSFGGGLIWRTWREQCNEKNEKTGTLLGYCQRIGFTGLYLFVY